MFNFKSLRSLFKKVPKKSQKFEDTKHGYIASVGLLTLAILEKSHNFGIGNSGGQVYPEPKGHVILKYFTAFVLIDFIFDIVAGVEVLKNVDGVVSSGKPV